MPSVIQTSKCTRCRNLRDDIEPGIKTCNSCRRSKAKYQRTETGRLKQQAAKDKWRKNTDKGKLLTWVHSRVYVAVNNGTLVKQPCEQCGNTVVHAHHDDYDKPLDVRWLCQQHHVEVHRGLG